MRYNVGKIGVFVTRKKYKVDEGMNRSQRRGIFSAT